jgi:hypothetical protein
VVVQSSLTNVQRQSEENKSTRIQTTTVNKLASECETYIRIGDRVYCQSWLWVTCVCVCVLFGVEFV